MTGQKDLRVRVLALLLLAAFPIASALAADAPIRNPNDDPALGDGVPFEYFGGSIVVDGDTAAIGSRQGVDADGNQTGSVRVFTRRNGQWEQQARLLAPYPGVQDAFGAALALQGDTLVVGAPNAPLDAHYGSGAAYVFERHGSRWMLAQTLSRPVRPQGSAFGTALAISGDTLAVGAGTAYVGDVNRAGSVHVFARDAQGWHAPHVRNTTHPLLHGWFSAQIAFAGKNLVVGAHGENARAGAVYAFTRTASGWSAPQRLLGSGVVEDDMFGMSIAAGDDRLLVGAPAASSTRSGFAVEWRKQSGRWIEGATLRPTNPVATRKFGLGVAHRGGDAWHVLAGRSDSTDDSIDISTYRALGQSLAPIAQAHVPNGGGVGRGMSTLATDGAQVYLGMALRVVAPWTISGEVLVIAPDGSRTTISPGGTATQEYFGEAVVSTPRWLMVGASHERRRSAVAGAVFVYDLDDPGSGPVATVVDPDGRDLDAFGAALARSGDTLIVGAPADGAGSVQAYELVESRWQRSGRWTPPVSGLSFSRVLAADAATLVVLSPGSSSTPGRTGGAAFVIERDGAAWSTLTQLTTSVIGIDEMFGESVDVSGDTIAIGSLTSYLVGKSGETRIDGPVRVFESSTTGWEEVAKLTRPAPTDHRGQFGSAVAIAGDHLFVGAPKAREVHVYARAPDGWHWSQRIEAPASAPGLFGTRIKVFDGAAWVSAGDDDAGRAGSLHRYEHDDGGWRLVQSLAPQPWKPGDGHLVDFTVANGALFTGRMFADGYASFVLDAGRVDVDAVGVFEGGFE